MDAWTPYLIIWATWSAMVCCRCSRTGTCGHCACAKSKQNMWQLPPGKAWKLHQHSISEPWHCSHVGYNHHCWCELHWSCYWRFFIFTQNTNLSCPFPLPSRLCEELVMVGLADMSCSSIPSHQMNFLQLSKSCLWTVRTLNYHTTLLNYHTFVFLKCSWHSICSICGKRLSQIIDDAYCQIIQWRPNLFKLPSGALGKRFIAKFSSTLQGFCYWISFRISIKVAMIQKPNATSIHISCFTTQVCAVGKSWPQRITHWGKVNLKTSLHDVLFRNVYTAEQSKTS